MNYINQDYFLPLLDDFYSKTKDLYDCGYDQGPFIPYTMPLYSESKLKIFYMGRDTYWWCPYHVLQLAYSKSLLSDYMNANKNCVDVDKMLSWKNNAGAFWTFVCKLHLFIRTGKYYDDIMDITPQDEEYKLLEEIGYGNLYAIETSETLKKEERGVWSNISDIEKYHKICNAAQSFEKLTSIIEAYNPDVIFIMTWLDKDSFFEETDYEWQKNYYEENFRAVYLSKTYKAKIIWTLHPRRFSFLRTNIQEMCTYLAKTLKMLL